MNAGLMSRNLRLRRVYAAYARMPERRLFNMGLRSETAARSPAHAGFRFAFYIRHERVMSLRKYLAEDIA